VKALDRKLLRDLWHLRAQALAIALLIGCAVAALVGSVTTWQALQRTQARYYESPPLPHVFAEVQRAPREVADRLAELPGVAEVEARLGSAGTVELERGVTAPITARLMSQPPGGSRLSRLHLRAGRTLAGPGEVLVGEGFAEAWGLGPGDRLAVVVNGRRERLRVVGVALSPEVIYAIRPGDLFPDDRHFALLWVEEAALAAALDLVGAFDEVALVLGPGADEAAVLAGVDRVLAPYGCAGAYGRDRHVSHRFLTDEIGQLRSMAAVVPTLFMGVAAFLVSLVVSRLVATERSQIGMLKALGWPSGAVAGHYAELVGLIALLGAALGGAGGLAMGQALARTYARYYRLPLLAFEGDWAVVGLSAALALAAALAGAAGALRRVQRLPPAEAMRPEAPLDYRPSLLERLGLAALLSQPGRMVVRGLGRRPVRAALGTLGLALAVAIMVVAAFMNDAIDLMLWRQLGEAQRQDLSVTFTGAISEDAVGELRALPGVRAVEGQRVVAAVLRHGHRSSRTPLVGLSPDGDLSRLVAQDGTVVTLPPAGLVLSRQLATTLGITPGERLRVEVAERRRPVLSVPVAALVDDLVGVTAALSRGDLEARLGEPGLVTGALVAVDPARAAEVEVAVARLPKVLAVTSRPATVKALHGLLDELLMTYMAVIAVLASGIAMGVAYNTGRIAWAERERELATLRVIGLTRGEAWRILAGELLALMAGAVPLGLLLGAGFVAYLAAAAATDLFRIPAVVAPRSYAIAALVVSAAVAVVALVARRWVARMDLVASLAARE